MIARLFKISIIYRLFHATPLDLYPPPPSTSHDDFKRLSFPLKYRRYRVFVRSEMIQMS